MDNIWCSEHQYAILHTKKKNICLWCKLESLQRERETLKKDLLQLSKLAENRYHEREAAEQKVESLQRDKAALIDVLEDVNKTPIPNYYTEYHPLVKLVRAARTILARMKGDTHA